MVATDVASRGIGMNDYAPAPISPFPSTVSLLCGYEAKICSTCLCALNEYA